eukprot:snap_masked-scaffold_22-processed-gene-0.30-mRNA-1 protein AED:1.00 eAED:1.00 QI:0/-1/0/0/-1/1/1/0/72
MKLFYKVSVFAFNPYCKVDWKRISEAKPIEHQKLEGLVHGFQLGKVGEKVVISGALIKRLVFAYIMQATMDQ